MLKVLSLTSVFVIGELVHSIDGLKDGTVTMKSRSEALKWAFTLLASWLQNKQTNKKMQSDVMERGRSDFETACLSVRDL